jgi:hypothetical protein
MSRNEKGNKITAKKFIKVNKIENFTKYFLIDADIYIRNIHGGMRYENRRS